MAQAAVDAAEKELGSNAQEHYRVPKTSVFRTQDQLKSSLETLSEGMREAAAIRAVSASAPEAYERETTETFISARCVRCVLYTNKILMYVGLSKFA